MSIFLIISYNVNDSYLSRQYFKTSQACMFSY